MTVTDALKLAGEGKARELYNSRLWRKKTKQILRRDRWECTRCKARKRYRRAQCVHHIIGLKENPGLALSDSNLTSLCKRCHNEVHGKAAKLNTAGKEEPVTPERW